MILLSCILVTHPPTTVKTYISSFSRMDCHLHQNSVFSQRLSIPRPVSVWRQTVLDLSRMYRVWRTSPCAHHWWFLGYCFRPDPLFPFSASRGSEQTHGPVSFVLSILCGFGSKFKFKFPNPSTLSLRIRSTTIAPRHQKTTLAFYVCCIKYYFPPFSDVWAHYFFFEASQISISSMFVQD